MSTPDAPLTGDALLAAVTDAMVALHQRYHHRAPVAAKTLLLGGRSPAYSEASTPPSRSR